MKIFFEKSAGFTLMELLVVIALLAVLATAVMTNWMGQMRKGYDSRRKSDLAKMKLMLENYYNDNGCFPTEAQWNSQICNSIPTFSPNYGRNFLCDPESKMRYKYEPIGTPPCLGYRIFARLRNIADVDISASGCQTGCGSDNSYNYGVTSGVPVK